ncbi:ABC transporter ATP-binding protein [Prochlorothrix hollandica]|uniref:ABC transporter ATP-binding protein n=1 Tax=Prochlorothrix hollandica TaxID=1223 RepID=UPI00333F6364
MSQTVAYQPSATSSKIQLDVELRNVFKFFGGDAAVKGIDLAIHQGEFFSILGPSGCGKTTTLRLIAGFEEPSSGDLLIRGQSMGGVPPYRRPVNTVFQSYALFNHMTVADNVAFGLRIKNVPKTEIRDRVATALALVKMESFAQRSPTQLSGGQQQRVALARALINRPAVLLLDEPLGALDLKLRKEMQVELSNLHQELGLTFVMVTHDQEEALSLSDRIAVMNHAQVEQVGTPREIYETPATPFVADFIGDTNLFEGTVRGAGRDGIQVETSQGLKVAVAQSPAQSNKPMPAVQRAVVLSLRPEKVRLSLEPVTSTPNCFQGRLRHVMYLGTHAHYLVELPSGDRIMVRHPNAATSVPSAETPVYVYWAAQDCLALDA